MNESKFEQEIKRILSDAEAPVSPAVWEGVSSRLPAKKVLFPLWRYAVAVGAAAAIAVGVFLLWPAKVTEQNAVAEVIISQEIPSISEQIEAAAASSAVARTESPVSAPAVSRVAGPGVAAVAAPSAAGRSAHSVPENSGIWAPTEVSTASVPENSGSGAPTVTEQSSGTETAAKTETEAKSAAGTELNAAAAPETTNDALLLEQLSRAEAKPAPGRLSFTASTNLQGTERQATGGNTVMRAPAKAEAQPQGITREDPEYNFSVPVTIGAGIRFFFGKHWSIGTGVQYTNMSRSFMGDYTEMQDDGDIFTLENTNINNMQHWLGVPLNVYYDIIPESKWGVHVFAGGTAEWLCQNHYLIHTSGNDIDYSNGHGFQFSVGGGVGVEYRITPSFGLYFDPSLRYYFDNNAPRSIRTIQPLRLDLQAGIRFRY